MDSLTAPLSDGALLAEESTMDPLSPLPSFLEMTLADATQSSGRDALSSALDAIVASLSSLSLNNSPHDVRYSVYHRLKTRICLILKGLIRRYNPEIRLLITYLAERHFLRSKSPSTMAESVYGMTRSKLDDTTTNTTASSRKSLRPLSERDKTRCALVLCLIPYAKERLDHIYERLKERAGRRRRAANGEPQGSIWDTIRRAFVMAYPFLHMSYEGTILAYQWVYLLGRSVYYSPSSHALGLIVRRTTLADLEQRKQKKITRSKKPAKPYDTSSSAPSSSQKKQQFQWQTTTTTTANNTIRITTLSTITAVVLTGWFLSLRNEIRQRRRRRIARSTTAASSTTRTDNNPSSTPTIIIPPPLPPPTKNAPTDSRMCPLCRDVRVNPAASSSGYVFCYRCLALRVRETGRCPVTGVKCEEGRIVRIFERV